MCSDYTRYILNTLIWRICVAVGGFITRPRYRDNFYTFIKLFVHRVNKIVRHKLINNAHLIRAFTS
jgi:hypothetical protein